MKSLMISGSLFQGTLTVPPQEGQMRASVQFLVEDWAEESLQIGETDDLLQVNLSLIEGDPESGILIEEVWLPRPPSAGIQLVTEMQSPWPIVWR